MYTEVRVKYDKQESIYAWEGIEPRIYEIAKELSAFGEFRHNGAKCSFYIGDRLVKSGVVVDPPTLSKFIIVCEILSSCLR